MRPCNSKRAVSVIAETKEGKKKETQLKAETKLLHASASKEKRRLGMREKRKESKKESLRRRSELTF